MRAFLQARGNGGAAIILGSRAPRLVTTSAAASNNGVGPPYPLSAAPVGAVQHHGSDDSKDSPVNAEGHGLGSQIQATAVDAGAQLPLPSPATSATTSQVASDSHSGLLTPSMSDLSLPGGSLSADEAASVGTADGGGQGMEAGGLSGDVEAGAEAGAGSQGHQRGQGPGLGSPYPVVVTFVVAQHPVALGESLAVVRWGRAAGGLAVWPWCGGGHPGMHQGGQRYSSWASAADIACLPFFLSAWRRHCVVMRGGMQAM